jgi:hypothetical protein
MNEDVILLAGLPGCGKTTYLCQMFREGWLVFDDFKAMAFNDCSKFRNSRKFRALTRALRDGLKCAVADIDFCSTESREEAERELLVEVPGVRHGWIFFANDPAACEMNIRRRNRSCFEGELDYVRRHSASYDIPQNAVVFPIGRKPSESGTGNCC